LLPPEYAREYQQRPVQLADIYIPLTARTVEYRPGLGPGLTMPDEATDEAADTEDKRRLRRELNRPTRTRVPLADVLAATPALIILGDPGAGKSTLLRRYALDLLDGDSERLPILLPLASYAKALEKQPGLASDAWVATYYEENGLPGLRPLFAHARR